MASDSNMFSKPVLIVGSPKSGTSILGRILENHSAFVHVKEPRLIWRFGNDGKSDILSEQDARPEVIAHIRKKFGEYLAQSDNKRLLEKSPQNALRLPFVLKVFPDAKIIHIMRNGYDTTLSIRNHWLQSRNIVRATRIGSKETVLSQRIKEMHWSQIPYYSGEMASKVLAKVGMKQSLGLWGVRLPGMRQMLDDLDFLAVCALQWRTCVELACQHGRKLPKDQYREYHLERINLESFKEMVEYMGLEMEDGIMEYYNREFTGTRSTARKSQADPEELERIRQWIEPTQRWLGYE